ncbi:MAG TPA: hypothetical protein VKT50_11620 [Candidatus Acidoferrales bacterium]|nr:hypothetical protein [Candidatus Acidoferrales bacterium]
MSEKLKLGENHRRVVSVLLRGLEQMCDEIEARLAEVPGVLRQVKSDLSHAQSAALREMTARVREEIRRLNTEIELDAAVRSPRRAILALLSASIVNLEESDSKRLRGYGPLASEAAARLDDELSRLVALLEEMTTTAEGD